MKNTQIFVADPLQRFTDILKESEFGGLIPTNYIIDKKRPGLGATHAELTSQRHSIIIEPYVAVIEVKKVKFSKALCVIMGKLSMKEVNERITTYMLDSSIHYKKFMTTPESFPKVIKILKRFDPEYQKNYFFLIDECEKWIKQALFRPKMLKPLDDFFKFKQKAMISATPLMPSHSMFQEQAFKVLEIIPTFDYKKEIKIVTTNNIRTSSRNILDHLFRFNTLPVFVFTNCRDTIYYLSQLAFVKDDFKVFCAEDLDIRFFKEQSLPNVNYTVEHQQYAKFNFLTSKFFSAVDIDVPTKANVLMITNIQQTAHSVIDPLTDAVQIYGRCRAGVESATHIANIYPDRFMVSKADIAEYTNKEIELVMSLKDFRTKSFSLLGKQVAESFIDKNFSSEIFNEDDSINAFKKDNLLDSRSVKSFYNTDESLLNEYRNCHFFKFTWVPVKHIFSDLDRLKIKRAKNAAKRKLVAEQLHHLITTNQDIELNPNDYNADLERLKDEDEFIFETYFVLGYEKLVELKFSKKQIGDAVFLLKKQEDKNPMLMIDRILYAFPLHGNNKYYCDDVKRKLQDIYSEFNYEKKHGVLHKAKASDIEDYFKCKLHNGKHKIDGVYRSWYRLFEANDKISNDLKYLTNR